MDNREITPNEVAQYLLDAKENYIIIGSDNSPVKWTDTNDPVVYGGKEDYEMDLQPGDRVITEYAYVIAAVNGVFPLE